MTAYPNIAARIFGTPLMIHPEKATVILNVLAPRLGFEKSEADETAAPMPQKRGFVPGAVPSRKSYTMTDRGVAVIPVTGTLVHRAASAAPPSMLWSYGEIEEQVIDAVNDSGVRGILLDIDSPGGEVNGVFDLADLIFQARGRKPIWAIADEAAYSAAYAIASAADRIILPRTGGVGSVGVIAIHRDVSDADKAAGLRYTTVFAGARKNDFNPHERLSPKARDTLQDSVDRIYGLFVEAVARNRGLTAEAVRDTEAGIFAGAQATEAGLADNVLPFRDALAALSDDVNGGTASRLMLSRAESAAHPPGNGEDESMTDAKKPAAAPEKTAAETTAAQTTQPAASATPAAPAAQPAENNVVDLDGARDQGRQEALAYVNEVNDLCALAGQPTKAAEYIAKGTPVAAIRKALIEARVSADEATAITTSHSGSASASSAVNNHGWDRAFAQFNPPAKQ